MNLSLDHSLFWFCISKNQGLIPLHGRDPLDRGSWLWSKYVSHEIKLQSTKYLFSLVFAKISTEEKSSEDSLHLEVDCYLMLDTLTASMNCSNYSRDVHNHNKETTQKSVHEPSVKTSLVRCLTMMQHREFWTNFIMIWDYYQNELSVTSCTSIKQRF